MNGTFVSKELFAAYIKGGRLWPQIQGGINVSILHQCLQTDHLFSIDAFSRSSLSEKQLQGSLAILNQDHSKAGIVLGPIPFSTLQKEWEFAKKMTLHSFSLFQKTPTHTISPSQIEEMKITANRVHHLIFRDHRALGMLYTLSLYVQKNKEHSYHNNKTYYDRMGAAYGFNSLNEPQKYCDTIEHIIQNELSKDNLRSDWISIGFNRNIKRNL